MRFDDANRLLEISVRELAEDDGLRRIGFDRADGWVRFGAGAELHARVLNERCRRHPEYRREVFVQDTVRIGDWTAVVTGRLDGCIQHNGHWLIEEFKSSTFSGEELRRGNFVSGRHQRQLQIYCDLWTRLGNGPVRGALIYVDIISGEETPFEISPWPAESGGPVETRLQALLEQWKAGEEMRRQKKLAGANLPFPHSAPRPGQAKLIESVRAAVAQGENLVAEAPTGSGKTAAGLHPALAHGLAAAQQIVFLTSKTLQQRMAVQALTAMNDAGSFRTLQVRAKEKMCANTQIICHEDFCPYAKNFPQKMERSKILDRLRESQRHHDPDEVFAAAKREEVCPFEVQLELAAKADAVVADYNYVFEPGTALRHLEDLSGAILLVDEAHNLPDRARQIFSPELREATVRAAQAFCGGGWKNIAGQSEKSSKRRKQPRAEQNELTLDGGGNGDCFEHVGEELKTLLDTLEVTAQSLPAGATIGETKPPARALLELWKNWETAFISYLLWKRARKIVLPDDPIVEVHFALQRFMAMWKEFFDAEQSNGFTCVVERAEKGIRLALLCLDPARALGKVFRASHAAIFLSATLRPTEKIQRTLGLEPKRTASVSLPPAFPRENRKILVLPQVRTTFAARDRNYPRIATLIREMADAVPGNVLALFPSYAFLAKVAELLPPVRAEIIAQRADFSDAERQKIFARLASPPPRGLLLLAVMGGMYAEGVDYPGELLLGVFVVSPALPQVSFERELLRRHFDEQEQAGFEYAYLQPGMTRVIQAAGRLIRSETDRGVIALICQRFLQEPYASYLPRDWYDESPTELTSQNPAEEIREFFAAPGRMEDLRR